MRKDASNRPDPWHAVAGGHIPAPTPQFRRRAWLVFQRALDPLARPRPLPPMRHD